MLARVATFAIVLCAVAVAVPRLAPGLLSAVERSAASSGPSAASQVPAAPPPSVQTASREDNATNNLGGYRQVALRADDRGHFVATAAVNGHSIDVIVDTGATTVALSDATAHRLGIYPALSAYTVRLSTANGMVKAAPVTLREIRLGAIAVRDVEAVVVPGDALPVSLLGMSFLKRLAKFEIAGSQLVLSQ